MSRASRARRIQRKAKSGRRTEQVVIRGAGEPCDCPDCTGEDLDPEQMLAEIVDSAADLADCDDPLEAELTGAMFVALATSEGPDLVEGFSEAFIPMIEAQGHDAALMMLTAVGAVAVGDAEPLAAAARAAAGRMTAGGMQAPRWSGQLTQPLEAGPFTRLVDADGTMSMLIGSFRRAGLEHSFIVTVDHDDCGAAVGIVLLDAADLPDAVNDIRDNARDDGVTVETHTLDAPAYRWHLEQALDARADHDADDADIDNPDAPAGEPADAVDGDGPPYPTLAALLRARLNTLPAPHQPEGAVGHGHAGTGVTSKV